MKRAYEAEISLPRVREEVPKVINKINSCLRVATEDPEVDLSELIDILSCIEVEARSLRQKLLEET